jgi:hypothetical protein
MVLRHWGHLSFWYLRKNGQPDTALQMQITEPYMVLSQTGFLTRHKKKYSECERKMLVVSSQLNWPNFINRLVPQWVPSRDGVHSAPRTWAGQVWPSLYKLIRDVHVARNSFTTAVFFFLGWAETWVHLLRRPQFGVLYQSWMIDECGALGALTIGT